jgi:hypothetical protein
MLLWVALEQVSYDQGRTWQPVTAVRISAGRWRVTITDPASGFVSLRSAITDSNGDVSTETVYRAFGVH